MYVRRRVAQLERDARAAQLVVQTALETQEAESAEAATGDGAARAALEEEVAALRQRLTLFQGRAASGKVEVRAPRTRAERKALDESPLD